ncbi:MFS transporter [Moraxella nasovis]|uniref:AmpG family muropeptide MFS transporter n=1 Tax=Moraxella nasovis TaxID=2904121 RepID=UPI001F611979|nr:MFS transporter [Moraxella nasovis]UNU73179.1 MFS transporter [Moraxella nasovis]
MKNFISSQAKPTGLTAFKVAYLNREALSLLFLGFSAGVPILLIFSSLGLWLREAGVDKSTVTMFSWAALGYSFKFIWSPLVDMLRLPMLSSWLGHRRSWLLITQIFIILAIVLMAMTDPTGINLSVMAAGAVLLGFSAATQDIVIDAYRIESAPSEMQTALSASYVAGYRIGMIVSGAGALYLADFFGSSSEVYNYLAWQKTYLIMGLVMGLAILTTLTIREPYAVFEGKKQTLNERIVGIYIGLLCVPALVVGIPFLVLKIATSLAGGEIALPSVIATALIYYFGALLAILPILIGFLMINQAKFHQVLPIALEQKQYRFSKADYVRLVAVFALSVIGFIVSYRMIGSVLPSVEDVAVSFLLGCVQFIGSILVMAGLGTILVKMGVVRSEVAKVTWLTPVADFFERYGKKALLLLALIGLYRISDIVAGNISNLFYQDLGFSKTDIANAVKLVGVVASIGGGFIGGWLAQRSGVMRSMMIGALLACVTNLLFIVLANMPSLLMMYGAVIADNLAGGLASAVFIAFLSALTSIRFTAVQYALFSSLMTLLPKVLGGYSGSIVEATSYPVFFAITFAIGLPILWLVWLVDKKIPLDNNE